MNARRLAKTLGWLSFGTVAISAVSIYVWADQSVEMITVYRPLWVYKVAFFGPLLATTFLVWRYRLFEQKLSAAVVVMSALVSFVGLMELLPRVVVLLNGPDSAETSTLQKLELTYVQKHYSRFSFVSTRVGIQYQDLVVQFETSRSNYFLLRDRKQIRAEIGQLAPHFYYVRHLQIQPGERSRARKDYWLYWWSGVGKFVSSMALIVGGGWLLSRVPVVRNRLGKINR